MSEKKEYYPGISYKELSDYLQDNHNVVLIESEMQELIRFIHENYTHPLVLKLQEPPADMMRIMNKTQNRLFVRDEQRTGLVWVKASTMLPATGKVTWRWLDKAESYSGYDEKRGFIYGTGGASVDPTYYTEIEWLDESGIATPNSEQEVYEFAEWAATIAFFDDGTRLWELIGEGKAINGQFRFTTKEFYQVFKQQP